MNGHAQNSIGLKKRTNETMKFLKHVNRTIRPVANEYRGWFRLLIDSNV